MSFQSFAELGVSPVVSRTLSARGIETPFAIQRLVIPDLLAGRDVLAKSPTGSGKTLAFGVPLVELIQAEDPRPSALVLAPTRELASQIVGDLQDLAKARALSIAAVYGGVGIERQSRMAARAHILVATPGRLEDLMARRAVDLRRVRILVLDEADRMLDMGFRPAVDRIVASTSRQRQTMFFSATLTGEVGRVADRYTTDAATHEHSAAPERVGDVEHRFFAVSNEGKLNALIGQLDEDMRGRTLIFVRTKRGADRLVKRLGTQSVAAVAMHGNKSQAQREKALARFHSGSIDVLVATDVAARGLDVDDVTHVINFDLPDSHESYTHRVGRTGRAGRTGIGITFVLGEEAHEMSQMAKRLSLQDEFAGAGIRSAHSRRAPEANPGGRRKPRPPRSSTARDSRAPAPTGRVVASAAPNGRRGGSRRTRPSRRAADVTPS